MPTMPPTFRPGSASDHGIRTARTSRDASQSLYDAQWARAAKAFLCANPLCRYCDLDGFVTAATLVDHFWPHRGDRVLFWDRRFWMPSCARCHNSMKKAAEHAGLRALQDLAARLGIDQTPPGGGKSLGS